MCSNVSIVNIYNKKRGRKRNSHSKKGDVDGSINSENKIARNKNAKHFANDTLNASNKTKKKHYHCDK